MCELLDPVALSSGGRDLDYSCESHTNSISSHTVGPIRTHVYTTGTDRRLRVYNKHGLSQVLRFRTHLHDLSSASREQGMNCFVRQE